MGDVYVDDIDSPQSAQFVIGDFCYFAGEAGEALVKNSGVFQRAFVIMVPQNQAWETLIEGIYPENAVKIKRYAIKKERDVFDRARLEQLSAMIPSEYEIRMIDEQIYEEAMREAWSRDLCSNFDSAGDYRRRGIGAAVLCEGKLVAGASSYTVYDGGIEIEIDTKVEFRRGGLACAAGARLILECLERGIDPNWDAHNRESVALAEKLGYHFDHEYTAYEVKW